jgi:hypothetical protein
MGWGGGGGTRVAGRPAVNEGEFWSPEVTWSGCNLPGSCKGEE